jgi:hypothetical protein
MIFSLFIFISTTYIIKFSMYLFSKCLLYFGAIFCFINPDGLPLQLIQISEGLRYIKRVKEVNPTGALRLKLSIQSKVPVCVHMYTSYMSGSCHSQCSIAHFISLLSKG